MSGSGPPHRHTPGPLKKDRILALAAQGLRATEIAERLGCHRAYANGVLRQRAKQESA